MTLTRRGFTAGSIGIASRASVQLCTLAVIIVATRTLPIAEFGAFAIATAFLFLSRQMFYVGPYEYLLKTPEAPALRGSCLAANFAFAVLTAIILYGVGLVSTPIFGTPLVGSLLYLLVPSLFIAMWTAWFEALMLRRQAITRYYLYTVVAEVAGMLAALLAFTQGLGVYALVVQIYARLAVLVISYAVTGGSGNWRHFEVAEVVRIARWSWSRYASVGLNFLTGYGADIILGIVLTPAATGIYRASNRIVTALSDLFVQPLQKFVQTSVSLRTARRMSPGDDWLMMLAAVAALGWSALAVLAAMAGTLVPLVLGAHWGAAVPVVVIFCFVRAFSLIDATTTAVLVFADRQRFMLKVQVVIAILALAVSAVLADLGPAAVAAGAGSVMVFASLVYLREAARISNVAVADVAYRVGVGTVPALGVFSAMLLSELPNMQSIPPLLLTTIQLAAAAAGALAGIYIIRRDFATSLRALGAGAGAGAGAGVRRRAMP